MNTAWIDSVDCYKTGRVLTGFSVVSNELRCLRRFVYVCVCVSPRSNTIEGEQNTEECDFQWILQDCWIGGRQRRGVLRSHERSLLGRLFLFLSLYLSLSYSFYLIKVCQPFLFIFLPTSFHFFYLFKFFFTIYFCGGGKGRERGNFEF